MLLWTGSDKGASKMNIKSEQHISGPEDASLSKSCVPDLKGLDYKEVLTRLHMELNPKSYLEIGTLNGTTFRLSNCPSIAIDPCFKINQDIIGQKPFCALYQIPSDEYFARFDPKLFFGRRLDLAFLDGMHRCEFLLRDFANTESHCSGNSIIALHDCVPVELPMAHREQGKASILPHRMCWWTGDVWRVVLALKKHRADLSIMALDAQPTGLILITNLAPSSNYIKESYVQIVREMFEMEMVSIDGYHKDISLQSTESIGSNEKLTRLFWM
jgi:hypothetical protein